MKPIVSRSICRSSFRTGSAYRPALVVLGVIVAVAVIGSMNLMSNMSNFRIPAGYAGYLYTKPIFGQGKFAGVLFGPTSSGWRWRIQGQLLSVTPYTYSEIFDANNESPILAKDKLPLVSNAHIVWRLRNDPASIQRFMQEFGGWHVAGDPDEIAKEAYSNYIKEPFRTITRSVVAGYNGLDVNEALKEISTTIEGQLRDKLASTPFEVLQVVMGNAAPPQSVIDAISSKVASEQNLEQRSIQAEIEQKNIEIQRKVGEASGAKISAEAIEQAKAITTINRVLTPAYLQYQAIENLKGAERVYLPVGANGMPLVGTLPVDKGAQPAAQ